MRLLYSVVLVAAALFASGDGASSVTNSKTITSYFEKLAEHNDVPVKRVLRTEYTTDEDEDEEERGITSDLKTLPGADKVKNLLTKKQTAANLNLAKAVDKLLEDPKFLAWAKYVDDYNMKHMDPEKAVSITPTLTKKFDDAALAKLLGAAAQNPSTKRLAESLQAQQLKRWKEAGLPVDDVFRKLKLDTGLDDILTNPLFLTFNKYLVDFNRRNPKKSTTTVETLSRSYGDAKVSKMLEAATKVDDTTGMATKLQAQQREVWKDMGLDTPDVLRALNLNKKTSNIFADPNFAVWTKALDDYSGGKTSTFDALWWMWGEKTLAQKLIESRQTKNSVVRKLQDDLIRKWLSLKTPPADVSKMLGTSLEAKTLSSRYKWISSQ